MKKELDTWRGSARWSPRGDDKRARPRTALARKAAAHRIIETGAGGCTVRMNLSGNERAVVQVELRGGTLSVSVVSASDGAASLGSPVSQLELK